MILLQNYFQQVVQLLIQSVNQIQSVNIQELRIWKNEQEYQCNDKNLPSMQKEIRSIQQFTRTDIMFYEMPPRLESWNSFCRCRLENIKTKRDYPNVQEHILLSRILVLCPQCAILFELKKLGNNFQMGEITEHVFSCMHVKFYSDKI